MSGEYYFAPFRFGDLIQKAEHPRVPLRDSVAAMIHLIAVSGFGEYSCDETLGCEIWDYDFDNITNTQAFKEGIRQSLGRTLEKHEPRLSQLKIDIQLQQVEIVINNRRTKSRITLKVDGVLTRTNEPFSYTEVFFMGPLSYY